MERIFPISQPLQNREGEARHRDQLFAVSLYKLADMPASLFPNGVERIERFFDDIRAAKCPIDEMARKFVRPALHTVPRRNTFVRNATFVIL